MPTLIITWSAKPPYWSWEKQDVYKGLTDREAEEMKEIYMNVKSVKGIEVRE